MTFKEIIAQDVKKTFLNTEEFSDMHSINGHDMPAQIDENEQIEREKRMHQNTDGIFTNQKLVYVSADDFGKLPNQGALFILDGRRYRVVDAAGEYGIYSITIEENRVK